MANLNVLDVVAARRRMKYKARKRQAKAKGKMNFTTALHKVRRSAVLVFLARYPGATPEEIAAGTGVPQGALRSILSKIERTSA